jgi:hypothetical protein
VAPRACGIGARVFGDPEHSLLQARVVADVG